MADARRLSAERDLCVPLFSHLKLRISVNRASRIFVARSPHSGHPGLEPGSSPSVFECSTARAADLGGYGCRIRSGMTGQWNSSNLLARRLGLEPGSKSPILQTGATRSSLHGGSGCWLRLICSLPVSVHSGTLRGSLTRPAAHTRPMSCNHWGSSRSVAGRRSAIDAPV